LVYLPEAAETLVACRKVKKILLNQENCLKIQIRS